MIPSYSEWLLEGVSKSADTPTAYRILSRAVGSLGFVQGVGPGIDALWAELYQPPPSFVKRVYAAGWYIASLTARGLGDINGSMDSSDVQRKLVRAFAEKVGDGPVGVRIEPTYPSGAVAPTGTVLYHAAPKKAIHRVLKQGLTPRTKSKITYHPERVYMAHLSGICDVVKYYSSFVQGGLVLLKIDAGGLRVIPDPNMSGAYFTPDNIPPSRIRIVDDDFQPDECKIGGWRSNIESA